MLRNMAQMLDFNYASIVWREISRSKKYGKRNTPGLLNDSRFSHNWGRFLEAMLIEKHFINLSKE